ncbi:hypothetical protein HG530_000578 [Fusarium avenaceum]|nr:hypothetical protein HG530_000578 [Fusarium avenaceum]
MQIRKALTKVNAILVGLENIWCQFMWNQKTALKPKVNQEMVVAEAMDKMESKTGMALERMKQRTQKTVTMVIQMDQERTLLAVISLWSLKRFMTTTYTGKDDTVGDLGNVLWGGAESRRDCVLTTEAVDGDGDNNVEGDGDNLEHAQGKAKVLDRVDHLSHVSDEVDVTGVGVADLEAGVETGAEVGVRNDLDVLVPVCGRSCGILDPERDHDQERGGDDGDHAGDAGLRDELGGTGRAEDPAAETADANEAHCADRVAGDGVEGDGEGDTGRSSCHDDLNHETDTSNDIENASTDNTGHINHVDNMRVP